MVWDSGILITYASPLNRWRLWGREGLISTCPLKGIARLPGRRDGGVVDVSESTLVLSKCRLCHLSGRVSMFFDMRSTIERAIALEAQNTV